jgi:flagellar basal-body rod protein FlgG
LRKAARRLSGGQAAWSGICLNLRQGGKQQMQDGAYSAMFGALTQEHRLDIIANNLANVNTSGYKPDRLSFEDTFLRYAHDFIREPIHNLKDKPLFPRSFLMSKPRLAGKETDFGQGALKKSDNPLDLAIKGEGFFMIRTPEGDFYSRNGHFIRTAEGLLTTAQGGALLGEGGPIAIPEGARIEIRGDGQIFADGELVDQIQLMTVSDLQGLEKYGGNLFRIREGSGAAQQPAPAETSIEQGYLETANVEVVTQMVKMIEAQRAFEAYSKVTQTMRESDTKLIQQVGTTR